MHELSVCRDIIDIVTRHLESAGGGRLQVVNVEAGPHSCINFELIRSAFAATVRDTELDGAEIAVRSRPLQYCCVGCGRSGIEKSGDAGRADDAAGPVRRLLPKPCPDCGSRRRRQEIDDAVTIRSMEIAS